MSKLKKALDSITIDDNEERLQALADYVFSDNAIAEDISAFLSDNYLNEIVDPVEFFGVSFENIEIDRLSSDETSNPRDELEYSMVVNNNEKSIHFGEIEEFLDDEELAFLKGCPDSYEIKIPIKSVVKHDGKEFEIEDSIKAEWSCKGREILVKALTRV